jgi:hypothetical protein
MSVSLVSATRTASAGVAAFVAWAKQQDGKLLYASVGPAARPT